MLDLIKEKRRKWENLMKNFKNYFKNDEKICCELFHFFHLIFIDNF